MPNIIDFEVCLKPRSYEMQYLYVNGEIKETVQPSSTCQNVIYIRTYQMILYYINKQYVLFNIIKWIVPVFDADWS